MLSYEILRQTPVQADSVEHLRKLLIVASGGVVFATIQKFMPQEKGGKAPLLSEHRNIVVIADEAHRSQYDLIDGLARSARLAPARVVHRLHRDADREDGRQYARGLRRFAFPGSTRVPPFI